MRIISGKAKGKKLTSFSGQTIRPTSDRVREALFSILSSRLGTLQGLNVLDLFTGSGALALEALSRGAAQAWLIDDDTRSLTVVRSNVAACHMEQCANIVRGTLPQALEKLTSGPFDLIFLDPPYAKGLIPPVLQLIAERELLSGNGILVAESGRNEELPPNIGNLQLIDQRHYGSTTLAFYERP